MKKPRKNPIASDSSTGSAKLATVTAADKRAVERFLASMLSGARSAIERLENVSDDKVTVSVLGTIAWQRSLVRAFEWGRKINSQRRIRNG